MNYLFDIDGTLTYPMQKMESQHVYTFLNWMQNKNVYLVAGSDYGKVAKQLPLSVLNRCNGVFTCMANELRVGERVIYQNEFKPPIRLQNLLLDFKQESKCPNKKKDFVETRTGMINFSTLGRSASQKEREEYFAWDKKNKERIKIAKKIEKEFPELEAKIGGQISMDIQKIGHNKSQASKWVRENVGGQIVYFGDKFDKDGNDYDIMIDVNRENGVAHRVNSPVDTFKILSEKYF